MGVPLRVGLRLLLLGRSSLRGNRLRPNALPLTERRVPNRNIVLSTGAHAQKMA